MTTTTTTVTRQYTLEKYSRSRSGSSSTSAAAAPIEWDHYSQPKLVVRLEATYDSSTPPAPGSAAPTTAVTPLPTKLLFQVTYDPLYRDRDRDHAPGTASTASTASTITLDSIDFCSFSSREYRLATPSDQLPLKAVYRDSILGIRYLALPPPPAGPSSSSAGSGAPPQQQQHRLAGEFRRVQLKFESKRDREQFVDAIRVLVPVKPAAEPVTGAAAPPTSTTKNQKRAGLDTAPQKATPAAASASKKQRKKRNETQQQQQQQQYVESAQQLGPDPYAYAGSLAPRPTTTTTSNSQYFATPPSQPSHVPHNAIAGAYEPPLKSSTMLGDPNPYLAAAGSLVHPTSRHHHQQQQQLPPLRLPRGLASVLPNIAQSSSRPSAAAPASSTTFALGQEQLGAGQQAAAPAAPAFRTASLALAALAPEDLDRVLREALFEEGFDEFVHRVKETLVSR